MEAAKKACVGPSTLTKHMLSEGDDWAKSTHSIINTNPQEDGHFVGPEKNIAKLLVFKKCLIIEGLKKYLLIK